MNAQAKAERFAAQVREAHPGLTVEVRAVSDTLWKAYVQRDTSSYEGSVLAALDAGEWIGAYWSDRVGNGKFMGADVMRRGLRLGHRKVRTYRQLWFNVDLLAPRK